MADQKVNELSTATPALTDYIMGMSGTAEYKALVSAVAKKIVEDYAGSTLAGSAQSVKSALDGLNSTFEALTITAATNVVIDTNKSFKYRGVAYIAVKGHATAAISNARIFVHNLGLTKMNGATVPIGVGALWDITGTAYGYLGANDFNARLTSGQYFHVFIAIPIG